MNTWTQWALIGGALGGGLGYCVGKHWHLTGTKRFLAIAGGIGLGGGAGYGLGRYTRKRQLTQARNYWEAKGDRWMTRDLARTLRSEGFSGGQFKAALERRRQSMEDSKQRDRGDAQRWAERFVSILRENGINAKLWTREGITRVYFPGEAGYLSFGWEGIAADKSRGRLTFYPSAMWKAQIQKYNKAYREYEALRASESKEGWNHPPSNLDLGEG